MLRKNYILFASILTLGLLLFYTLKNKKSEPTKNYQITTTTVAPSSSTIYKPEEETVINPSIETVVPQPKKRKIISQSKTKKSLTQELEQNQIIDTNSNEKTVLVSPIDHQLFIFQSTDFQIPVYLSSEDKIDYEVKFYKKADPNFLIEKKSISANTTTYIQLPSTGYWHFKWRQQIPRSNIKKWSSAIQFRIETRQ